MKYTILASGSSGNATLIQTATTTILIDCGISKRRLVKRLEGQGLGLSDIDALLLTHSHGDHLISWEGIEEMFGNDKIFALPVTYSLGMNIDPLHQYHVGDITFFPIPLSHDVPTVGYIVVAENQKLVYITDTGYVHQKLLPLIADAHHLLVESNYDEAMLYDSGRSKHLISRIVSPSGHLSNLMCRQLLEKIIGEQTISITLMHISADCNKPEIAYQTVKEFLPEGIELRVAKRVEEEEVVGQ